MQTIAESAAWLGIDWGTSNRRCWWMRDDGSVLADHADDQGLLASQGRFAEALDALIQQGPTPDLAMPVLMSGMVGSARGWQEVPYLDSSVPLDALGNHLARVGGTSRRCLIVPGILFDGGDGSVDVMRGEETQLLGAQALGHGDGWYVLPGTHSKWVRLASRRVAEFATFLTGELFALLTQHGTLASITGEGEASPAALQAGLAAAGRSALSNALFGCRAAVVSGRMPAGQAREYLSGLLIGAEWHDIQRRHGAVPRSVTLIGSPALARRYTDVASTFGCTVEAVDPVAVQLAAFRELSRNLQPVLQR